MPAIAKEFLANLPWGVWGQAVVMLLLAQAQLFGTSSPLAVAWLCARLGDGQTWALWVGLTAGALLTGGVFWWTMPVIAGALLAAWRLTGRRGMRAEIALPLAGCLTLADAVARTGADPAMAMQWLICALIAVVATVIFSAMGGGQARLRRGAHSMAGVREQRETSPATGKRHAEGRWQDRAGQAHAYPPNGARSGHVLFKWINGWRRLKRRRAFVGLAENVGGQAFAGKRKYRFPPMEEGQARECPAGGATVAQEFPEREKASVLKGWRRSLCAAVGLPKVKGRDLDAAGGLERENAAERRLMLIGRAVIGIGASAGAAAAFGGEASVLIAAAYLVHWPEAHGDALAIAMAAVLAASGVPLAASSAIVSMWAALRLLERWGRPVQALGSLAAAGLWLLAGGMAQALGYLAAMAPAAALVMLLPRRRTKVEIAQDAQMLQERLSQRTQDQLKAMADVLAEMAQGNGSGPDPPQEDALLLSLRARLCEGCVRYERCWNGRAGEGLRLLCELITKSVNGTLPERVLPDMMRRCMRANIIPNRLYAELNRFAQARSARIARMDGVQRAQLTIDTAAEMLRAMAHTKAESANGADLRLLEQALHRGGVADTAVCRTAEGLALFRSGGWTNALCERASWLCGRQLGERYAPDWRDGQALCLRPVPALAARMGWDGISAEGSRSGDSLYIGALDDRRQLVVISDGMGIGAAAAGESQKAVAAVKRFLQSGIDPERSALLANQLLTSQGCGDMFATLDLCVIDNGRMEATWVKMAACDSFLLRGSECRVIPGGRLPMGIVAEAAPQVSVARLLPGDVIVMGTDGAMEGLDAEAAQQCIASRKNADAMRLARCLRQAGEARRIHVDDQTLAVIRMEKAETAGGEIRRTAGG